MLSMRMVVVHPLARSLFHSLVCSLIGVAAAACGTPSRRLSTRAIDDPMVLPRRMAEVSLDGSVSREHPGAELAGAVLPRIDYGLTDRLELADLFSLRYAFLDDAPRAPERIAADPLGARDPLSLSVRAGATGIGYGSLEGMIVTPVVEVAALRHIGASTSLALQLGWYGQWVANQSNASRDPYSYSDRLWPTAQRNSHLAADLTAARQLTDHLSASLTAGIDEAHGGLAPWHPPRGATGGSLALGAAVRPWPWLALRASAFAGTRFRPAGAILVTPPAAPLVRQLPESITWLGASAGALFRW
jgi:hypothetical protein